MTTTWFTSDLHFGHKNILKFTRRPWPTVDEMDVGLIDNWNNVVAPGDTVYIVGDFSFHKHQRTMEILAVLRGQKHLVKGNHDVMLKKDALECFASVRSLKEVTVEGQRITLCHYALRVWNQSHRGAWALHGHSHGTLVDDPNSLSVDVGIDTHPGFRPYSFGEIKNIMSGKTWKPVDHHGMNRE